VTFWVQLGLIAQLDVWRPLPDWLGGEQPYDLNSWQESETALALAETLDEDAVIVEGYAEYATWRPHLAYLRDPYGDPDMEMEIDGVGGVSILAKAKVFRSGVHFPAFSFEKHAETEGFGKVQHITMIIRQILLLTLSSDGETNEVFSCWSSPLHNLASLRA
jgi:mannan polymerase II complex ANP1 subunit